MECVNVASEGKFSVLMAIYSGNDPFHVEIAVQSTLEQTAVPAEIVIVRDGPVASALEGCLEEISNRHKNRIRMVRLPENVGHGRALQSGLECCKNELVARMDGDDLSMPDRFEKQLKYLDNNPNIAAVGGWVEEFESDPKQCGKVRKTPCGWESVRKYARYRNPLNHPTVMFRKSIVEAVGGYCAFPNFDDYHLWMRLIYRGERIDNIPEVLLRMRTGKSFYQRRGGIAYAKNEIRLQREFLRMGAIGLPQFVVNILIRTGTRLVPGKIREIIYDYGLRK